MYADIDRILYSREVIEERVKELAGQVVGVYRGRPFTAIVTLQGAFVFAADLLRHVPNQVKLVFVRASSYGASTSPERDPAVELPPGTDLRGEHVLLIEDIVDTGRTVTALRMAFLARGAASVRICAFLDKPSRRQVPVDAEFTGFTLAGDPFVVGYGLDFAGKYRNLPFVGTLKSGLLGHSDDAPAKPRSGTRNFLGARARSSAGSGNAAGGTPIADRTATPPAKRGSGKKTSSRMTSSKNTSSKKPSSRTTTATKTPSKKRG